jgi:hypothetical protein
VRRKGQAIFDMPIQPGGGEWSCTPSIRLELEGTDRRLRTLEQFPVVIVPRLARILR